MTSLPAPSRTMDILTLVSGKGRLGHGRNTATFEFRAGLRLDAPDGKLSLTDHGAGLKIESTSIDTVSVPRDATCWTFTGRAQVNGVKGFCFTVRETRDDGEAPIGKDRLAISVVDPDGLPFYMRSGMLTGGNVQLRRDALELQEKALRPWQSSGAFFKRSANSSGVSAVDWLRCGSLASAGFRRHR